MDDRLDREAVDRVLRRAHAIDDSADPLRAIGVDPAALVEAAAEVGIDPDAVRDSIAIERFVGPPAIRRRFDGIVGPERVVVEREMHVSVVDALAGLESWMASVYRLAVDRRTASTLFARRRTDTFAQVSRSFASARGEGRLAVRDLVAEAVPQIVGSTPDQPRCLVRISADRSPSRTARLSGGASLSAGGVGVGGAAAAVADALVAWPVVATPLVVVGYAVARSGRGQADHVELELERLLSRVDRGERPSGLLDRVTRRARGVMAPIDRQRRG